MRPKENPVEWVKTAERRCAHKVRPKSHRSIRDFSLCHIRRFLGSRAAPASCMACDDFGDIFYSDDGILTKKPLGD